MFTGRIRDATSLPLAGLAVFFSLPKTAPLWALFGYAQDQSCAPPCCTANFLLVTKVAISTCTSYQTFMQSVITVASGPPLTFLAFVFLGVAPIKFCLCFIIKLALTLVLSSNGLSLSPEMLLPLKKVYYDTTIYQLVHNILVSGIKCSYTNPPTS